MTKLVDIEGIGESYASKLKSAGVRSVESLLEKGGTPKGRKEIAENSGVNHNLILRWVNHADLFRIKGVGEEYADLLEAVGVDTVVELSKRRSESLYEKMAASNAERKRVRLLPSLKQVTKWVAQAKKLPRKVSY